MMSVLASGSVIVRLTYILYVSIFATLLFGACQSGKSSDFITFQSLSAYMRRDIILGATEHSLFPSPYGSVSRCLRVVFDMTLLASDKTQF